MPRRVAAAERRFRRNASSPVIFILDNFDSFTYNIAQAIQKLGYEIIVKRAHETSLSEITALQPTHLILSPGPGRPKDHPFMFDVLTTFASSRPILGVCLGMQAINEWCGGTLRKDSVPVHGKTSKIFHNDDVLFTSLPSPFVAARYHSLVIDRLADGLEPTAWTNDRLTMGARHRTLPIVGVQFHPESYLTECGEQLFKNFLNL